VRGMEEERTEKGVRMGEDVSPSKSGLDHRPDTISVGATIAIPSERFDTLTSAGGPPPLDLRRSAYASYPNWIGLSSSGSPSVEIGGLPPPSSSSSSAAIAARIASSRARCAGSSGRWKIFWLSTRSLALLTHAVTWAFR
jgi:hypothetical protein